MRIGIAPKIQFIILLASLVGIGFGFRSYYNALDLFGAEAGEAMLNDIIIQIAVAVAVNIIAGILLFSSVTKPLNKIIWSMNSIENKDFEREVPHRKRGDEIGSIARRVQAFKENAMSLQEAEEEQKYSLEKAAEERREILTHMAEEFDSTLRFISGIVANSSDYIETGSASVASSIEVSRQKISALNIASARASENVGMVAVAAESLATSIRDISAKANESLQVANAASEDAEKAGTTLESLTDAVQQIDDVVGLINNLAEQINILALNATIEAARAGESGRGFDVVASEVKSLSHQTESATEKIGRQVDSIKRETKAAFEFIDSVCRKVAEISKYTGSIAEVAEQQNASARNMEVNLKEAAANTNELNKNVGKISEVSKEAGENTSRIISASNILLDNSGRLYHEAGEFLVKIRSGA